MEKILKFKDFLIEQTSTDEDDKKIGEIRELDDEINQTKLDLKKKQLEILKRKKQEQDKGKEDIDL